jgi:hypothetical protein
VPHSPQHDASHLDLGGPLPCSPSFQMLAPCATRMPGLAFWRGMARDRDRLYSLSYWQHHVMNLILSWIK